MAKKTRSKRSVAEKIKTEEVRPSPVEPVESGVDMSGLADFSPPPSPVDDFLLVHVVDGVVDPVEEGVLPPAGVESVVVEAVVEEGGHSRSELQIDAVGSPGVVFEDSPSPALTAFNQIAEICGCPTWDYPGQLVRDVRALADERDALRLERDLLRDEARQVRNERDSLRRELDSKTPPDVRSLVLEAVRKNPGATPAELVDGLLVPGGQPRSRLRSELLGLLDEGKVVLTMERKLRLQDSA